MKTESPEKTNEIPDHRSLGSLPEDPPVDPVHARILEVANGAATPMEGLQIILGELEKLRIRAGALLAYIQTLPGAPK